MGFTYKEKGSLYSTSDNSELYFTCYKMSERRQVLAFLSTALDGQGPGLRLSWLYLHNVKIVKLEVFGTFNKSEFD